jgi:bifunctional non-homologous end joining protein LigD
MQEKSISLYSDKGGADKVYNVFLVASGNDFKVNYQNGARGSTLTNGTKTASPVAYDKAVAIFDKLVKEKMAGSSK